MATTKTTIPQDKIDRYERVLAMHPELERKGAANPYTSLNGHMFSGLNKEGELGLRLSKTDREAFQARYNSPPFISYNTIMKEYVNVPEELFDQPEELLHYFDLSLAYIKSLKPKPTKRST